MTQLEMLLDSGSSVSLLQQGEVPYDPGNIKTLPELRTPLITAAGEHLLGMGVGVPR